MSSDNALSHLTDSLLKSVYQKKKMTAGGTFCLSKVFDCE
jgi:hypothetical protein